MEDDSDEKTSELNDNGYSMRNDSIVLTGATGFLGAFLMKELLERGYYVIVLGRSSKGIKLSDRLSGLVRWFGIPDPKEKLYALEADLSKQNFGLDNETYNRVCVATRKVIHCASDTSFTERNRTRVMETNVNNLSPLLNFAKDAKVDQLYYVSTAYAAGIHEGVCLEALTTTNSFVNVYEESKALAEGIIYRFCENNGVPLSILRPSIVYGHSKTGASLKFNALYYPVKSLMFIRDIFLKDVLEHGARRSKQWGVCLADNGTLFLPLKINLPRKGTVNLIPVDYFSKIAMSIFEDSKSGGIYHITSDEPSDMTTLVEYSERFLGLRGIRVLWDVSEINSMPNPIEELFDRLIEPYRPYLSDLRTFDQSQTKTIISGIATPHFTYDIFERCMMYAVACDWGKKINNMQAKGS